MVTSLTEIRKLELKHNRQHLEICFNKTYPSKIPFKVLYLLILNAEYQKLNILQKIIIKTIN